MKTSAAIAICFLILTSCTAYHHAEYKKEMDSWIGKSMDDVKRYWGPPLNSDSLSTGEKMLVYASQGSGANAIVPVGGIMVATNNNRSCRTVFFFDLSDHVERYTFEGKGCGRD